MSAYVEVQSVLEEEEFLIQALRQMGFTPEVHRAPVMITDYHNQSRPAHIVISQEQTRGCAAIGFYLDPQSGQYNVIVDEDDKTVGAWIGVGEPRRKYDEAWIHEVEQAYMEHRSMAVAAQEGLIFDGRTVDEEGTIELRFLRLE